MKENLKNPIFSLRDVGYSYSRSGKSQLNPIVLSQVLFGLNIDFHLGEFTCIAGPSGSGKSTLLNLLGFIESIQSGIIHYNMQDIRSVKESRLNEIRMFELGFVFQDFQLIDVLSVFENVEYFVARQGHAKKIRTAKVLDALDAVAMADYRHRYPSELSGGQKQRVAIARALAKSPKVIIADEPTANLDSKNSASIAELIHILSEKHKVTTIMASHDPVVKQSATRLIELRDGIVVGDSHFKRDDNGKANHAS